MYENQTFENILDRLLKSGADQGIDIRPGSIYYSAVAPAAAEMAQLYIELDSVLELGHAETSNGEWLSKRTGEFGVDKNKATPAIRMARFNTSVSSGVRFYVGNIYFTTLESGTDVKIQCESNGVIGNQPEEGELLIPVRTVPGLQSAILGEIVIPGQEEESEESLKQRHRNKVRKPSKSGNVSHYEEWTKEVNGVGEVRVFPLWAGRGTVKVVITGPELTPAPYGLVETVQNYLDPTGSSGEGKGKGKAPIGATVTVESASVTTIDIDAVLELSSNTIKDNVKDIFIEKAKEYLQSIALNQTIIRQNRIGAILLSIDGVKDYHDLKMNGTNGDVTISSTDIPVLGEVTLNE